MLGFRFFQEFDNLPHAGELVLGCFQTHIARGYLARVNRLAQSKLALGAFDQHRKGDAVHCCTGYIFRGATGTIWKLLRILRNKCE